MHLIDIDKDNHSILPPLQSFDLSWIRDPSFYRDIKESVEQKPYFIGSFYRKILDKIEGLDAIAVVSEIDR